MGDHVVDLARDPRALLCDGEPRNGVAFALELKRAIPHQGRQETPVAKRASGEPGSHRGDRREGEIAHRGALEQLRDQGSGQCDGQAHAGTSALGVGSQRVEEHEVGEQRRSEVRRDQPASRRLLRDADQRDHADRTKRRPSAPGHRAGRHERGGNGHPTVVQRACRDLGRGGCGQYDRQQAVRRRRAEGARALGRGSEAHHSGKRTARPAPPHRSRGRSQSDFRTSFPGQNGT